MNSVIDDLYKGNFCPDRKYNLILEHHRKKQGEAFKRYQALSEKLEKEYSEELEAVLDDTLDLLAIEMEESFADGLSFGIRLMCEVFGEGDMNILQNGNGAVNDGILANKGTQRANADTVQHDIVELLEWIAENQETWVNICEPSRLDFDECLYLIDALEKKGFLQLIPVVLTQTLSDVKVDKAFTRLFLTKIAESWKHMAYTDISNELETILNEYKEAGD